MKDACIRNPNVKKAGGSYLFCLWLVVFTNQRQIGLGLNCLGIGTFGLGSPGISLWYGENTDYRPLLDKIPWKNTPA